VYGSLPRSLSARLILACSIVAILVAAGIGTIVSVVADSQANDQHRELGRQISMQMARSIGAEISRVGGSSVTELLAEARDTGLIRYATIFDANGSLVATASAMNLTPPVTAREFGALSEAERPQTIGGLSFTEFDAPIRAPHTASPEATDEGRGRMLGTLRIAISRENVIAHVSKIRRNVAVLVLASAVLAALASILVVRFAFQPLRDLVDATKQIGSGEFRAAETRLPMDGELGELSSALIAMHFALEAKSNELSGSNRDLERRIAERTQRLQAALDEAQKAERTRDNILSCISHEFRTPLASVRAFAEILLQHPDESVETRREFLEIILVESERLGELVTNILDYVKFLSGDVNWILDPVDLLAVSREAATRFETLLSEHRMTLKIEARDDLPTVRCDHDKILRAVSNLLSNAIKFSPDGAQIELRASSRAGAVDLAVIDHGIGIAPEDRDRIFQRFHQTEDTLTGKPQGSGLGLPIAREIVERHGGTLRLESAKGHGSTFHMVLPIDGPSEDELRRSRTAIAHAR